MWLDKLHSFVKAGKVFNHSVFLTLYHSCCTPYKCEYLHQWPLLFFYVPYISLIFTHLAYCPWVSSLSTDEGVVSVWMNCRQTQLLLFVEAVPQAQSSAHGRAQCVRLDLGQAVLAPISKIQFCTTLLRLQLPGRANFCCLCSQWAIPGFREPLESPVLVRWGQQCLALSCHCKCWEIVFCLQLNWNWDNWGTQMPT